MTPILRELFVEWNLDTWANILEVVGAIAGVASFVISLRIKSQVKKLRASFSLDKRIADHIKKLTDSASTLNRLFQDYDNRRDEIKIELSKCHSELEDVFWKIHFQDSKKVKRLIRLIKKANSSQFPKAGIVQYGFIEGLFKVRITTYEEAWDIYSLLHGVIRQIENVKKNMIKSYQ